MHFGILAHTLQVAQLSQFDDELYKVVGKVRSINQ